MKWIVAIIVLSAMLNFTDAVTGFESRTKFPVEKISPYCPPMGYDMFGPPQIRNVSISEDDIVPEKPVHILVETTDGSGSDIYSGEQKVLNITQGKLFYTTNKNNPWMEVPLHEKQKNLWEGEIPSFPEGTEVSYYTWFQDEFDHVATEMKPDVKSENFEDVRGDGKFLFPSEKDMVLVYEYDKYNPSDYSTKKWENYVHGIIEKVRVKKVFYGEDMDYQYFLLEFGNDTSEIEKLYGYFHGVWSSVWLWDADEVEKFQDKDTRFLPFRFVTPYRYSFSYWITLPTDFLDTLATNCGFCFLKDIGVSTFISDLPDEGAASYKNKVYYKIERGTVPEHSEKIMGLQAAVCGDNADLKFMGLTMQLSSTSESYVYLRTHSYEL